MTQFSNLYSNLLKSEVFNSGTILKYVYLLVANSNNIYHMLQIISYSESEYPITPVKPSKPRFWHNSEFFYF